MGYIKVTRFSQLVTTNIQNGITSIVQVSLFQRKNSFGNMNPCLRFSKKSESQFWVLRHDWQFWKMEEIDHMTITLKLPILCQFVIKPPVFEIFWKTMTVGFFVILNYKNKIRAARFFDSDHFQKIGSESYHSTFSGSCTQVPNNYFTFQNLLWQFKK